MTHEEMMKALDDRLHETRATMVTALGTPIVACIEGLGYRIVPAWVVESLVRVLSGPKDAHDSSDDTKGPT